MPTSANYDRGGQVITVHEHPTLPASYHLVCVVTPTACMSTTPYIDLRSRVGAQLQDDAVDHVVEVWGDTGVDGVRGVGRARRPGPDRKDTERLDSRQGAAPVRELAVKLPRFQPAPLPRRPVHVLDRQLGERA